ncbi:MAG TPA: hypothetical protein VK501_25325 [Baekduia sp.]|uniref:right-handed parallel beta-helix repeat-containing protein n=1 Tax=Baekduia sp. TaxID=2600305 RepID=UPI002CC919E5|nr:hypothetical protein [Baekduia sp.]HMJ37250.1 hypothetical protein [Baekduia sp.]
MSHRTSIVASATALVAALAFVPIASAVDYPPPSKPGSGANAKPKGPFRTLKVCKAKKSCFPRIQDAVNEAKPGDTIKVAHGTYREGVKVAGVKKRFIKLIGDPKDPSKVILEGKDVKGSNGIQINGANEVTVNGFQAQHYKANGFFAVNVNGYTFTNVKAFLVGVYGVYAFNSVGGTITNSEAAWNSDSGFYIGQTPPQTKPVRSIVRNIKSYGNVLGWSGTNMRYVTISKSKFYNNGTGVVPNALSSEKYAPAEENVITDNDIFWNNFNYYAGAPFKVQPPAADSTAYPVGVGVLLFGGRHNRVENNRIYGNWLMGAGMIQQFLLTKVPDAMDLVGNSISNNQFGANGTDLNGRDLGYDGNGKDNCASGNTGVAVTVPADASTLPACPFTGANAFSADVQKQLIDWALDGTHEAFLVKHDHAPQAGLTALERYTGGVK